MRSQNLSDQLVHKVGQQIISGELQPHDVLPKVEIWSDELGVSRTVIREALKGLSARGLVQSNPKVGTVIRPRTDWQWWDPDVLDWATKTKSGRTRFIQQLNEIRLEIEPTTVKFAARNATEGEIALIAECFKHLNQSVDDAEEWAKYDYEFHHSILMASHNELMLYMVQLMRRALLRSRIGNAVTAKSEPVQLHMIPTRVLPINLIMEYNKKIFEGVRDREPDAAGDAIYELVHRTTQLLDKAELEASK